MVLTSFKSQIQGGNGYNPYFYEGREIKNIIFFKDGKILGKTRWFTSNNEYPTIAFDFSIVKKIKEDLQGKQAYYMKAKNDSFIRETTYNLYIHADLVNFKSLGEKIHMDTDTYTSYIEQYEVTVWASTRDSQAVEERTIRFTANQVSRSEEKDFQKEINAVEAMLKDKGVKLPSYELQQLLKHFTITPKA